MDKNRPLADRIRPTTLDDVVGQRHILGESGVLRRLVESGNIPNMIFFGPSGTGKTTVANIIAAETKRALHRLNATTASVSDIKDIIAESGTLLAPGGVMLYLDEIQYFNKKQQQSLLEFIENGSITLIASTTENPYFYVYGAILSRSTVFEFRPVDDTDVERAFIRAAVSLGSELGVEFIFEEGVASHVAMCSSGDVRKAINTLEVLTSAGQRDGKSVRVTLDDTAQVTRRSATRFDKDGDSHYDLLSAYQKSMRGSDPDAAVYYLARILAGGDLVSACRRLMVTAAEDVGLAYPQALQTAVAAVLAAERIGLPEAMIPLAEAVILVATSPKSNSAIGAIGSAMSMVESGKIGMIPAHIKDGNSGSSLTSGSGEGYKYAHNFANHWVKQQYLPDELKDVTFYTPGDNKTEQAADGYWKKIKG